MFTNTNESATETQSDQFTMLPTSDLDIVSTLSCVPQDPPVIPIASSIVRYNTTPFENELNYLEIAKYLENEKNKNKQDSWNKLDKTDKIQKLHAFAEKYGKDNGIPIKEIKNLKMFFKDCLEKNKLQKTKDVVYDKELHSITSIPALLFNVNSRAFTLKIMDLKRVSTIKSLTPKRGSEKNKTEIS